MELHYVEGGSRYSFNLPPGLAANLVFLSQYSTGARSKSTAFLVVDIRGMGTSGKPESGYDKKTMAKDIYELIQQLGLKKVHLLGHDIGGMVAMSTATQLS